MNDGAPVVECRRLAKTYHTGPLDVPVLQHAWDKTSATGKVGNYDETTAGAKSVFDFLNSRPSLSVR